MKCTCKLKIIPTDTENCPVHNPPFTLFGMNVIFDETLPHTIILVRSRTQEIHVNLETEEITVREKK